MQNRISALLVLLLLSALLLAQPLRAQEEAAPELRIGLLPVLNRLPLTIAEAAGYFTEAGVSVTLKGYQSSVELQSAFLAGEIDGYQADLVSNLKVISNGGDLRLVRHVEILNAPFFALMVGPGSEIQSVEELRGQDIAISRNTVVEYIADTMLAGAGIANDEVAYLDSPSILQRVQNLLVGNYTAVVLPQPAVHRLSSLGARVLLEDTAVDYVPEALSFSAAALAEKGEAVRAFLAAYERAIADLNGLRGERAAFEELARRLSLDHEILSNALIAGFSPVPRVSRAGVPDEAQVASVLDWAVAAGILADTVAYAELVDGSFLPAVSEDERAAEDAMWAAAAAPAETVADAAADLTFLYGDIVPDFLPLIIAQEAGYFAEAGITVALVEHMADPILGEDNLGEYDGRVGNILDLIRLNDAGYDLRAVRYAPFQYAILLQPGSELQSLAELAGATMGWGQTPSFLFIMEQFLALADLSMDDVTFAREPGARQGMLVQYQKLVGGEFDAALLSEPFITYADQYDTRILVDSSALGYKDMTLLFQGRTLEEKGEAVRAFLAAYERAVATINAMAGDAAAFRAFSDRIQLNHTAVTHNIYNELEPLPTLETASVPDEEFFHQVQDWLLAKGHISEALAYEDVVDGSFLPELMAEE